MRVNELMRDGLNPILGQAAFWNKMRKQLQP